MCHQRLIVVRGQQRFQWKLQMFASSSRRHLIFIIAHPLCVLSSIFSVSARNGWSCPRQGLSASISPPWALMMAAPPTDPMPMPCLPLSAEALGSGPPVPESRVRRRSFEDAAAVVLHLKHSPAPA